MERNVMREVTALTENYSGKELSGKIIEKARMYKNDHSSESALQCCMTGMAISLERLAEQDDRTHFDVFLDVFTQSLAIVEPDLDGLLDYCLSTVKVIEMYEEKCPQSSLIMPLIMTTLDIAAEYGMKVNFPGAAVALYEYQRDKFVGYSEYFSPMSFNSRLASIDGKMILPYILNGQREEARSVGEEAFDLLKELLPQNPRKYLADFLSVCANLGGIYMDANELDAAEKVFDQGSTAWGTLTNGNGLPLNFENLNFGMDVASAKHTLDTNIAKLENKKKADISKQDNL